MVPNTNIDLPILGNQKTIELGNYKLQVILESDKKWEEELSFTVASKSSKMIEDAEQSIQNS